ncbi:MAG: hypothetical protein BGO32_08740 [Bacteroidetes bacterium 37-13]|nr:MAG: hypothetical protein BGO32_08740 [Bacteroidetes bacterium 37-13]
MKKIKIKLTYDEMDCFIHLCYEFGNDKRCTHLIRATLLQLWFRSNHRTQFKFKKTRSFQLTIPEAIATCAAVGNITLDNFDPFTLSVITPIYQNIQQQL